MTKILAIIAAAVALSTLSVSCSEDGLELPKQQQTEQPDNDGWENGGNNDGNDTSEDNGSASDNQNGKMMEIGINGKTFTAVLNDSNAAAVFRDMLPLTLDMNELNGNEKYCNLDTSMPASPVSVGNIETGDLMLWGGNCLVLFYKSFRTSYSYTRIGRIGNPSGLAEAVGKGNVKITFRTK